MLSGPNASVTKRFPLPLLFVAVTLCGLSAGSAQAEERYVFDKAHTTIEFAVSNFGLFDIKGEFAEYDGSFVFCLGHPEEDSISITLYSDGIHDTSGEPDEELRGPHFFDATRFPRIDFVSNKVVFTDKENADVLGDLTLLGVTKPVTLHVHFLGNDSDPDGDDYVVNFSASASIDRSDFGMDYLSPFIVGDEVRLSIEVRGIESDTGDSKEKSR